MKIYNLTFFLFFLLTFPFDHASELPLSSPHLDIPSKQKLCNSGVEKPGHAAAANIIFKSADGGQTWQDISEGLPVDLQEAGIAVPGFIANDNGLYIRFGKEIYHSEPNPTVPSWKKEIFPDERGNIAPGKNGIYTYNWQGQTLQKINGSKVWTALNTNFKVTPIRSVFETVSGAFFIAGENGLFKSDDSGKTLKQVFSGGWVIKIVESNGVLMATSQGGIIRSTDAGESWDFVLYEGGVGIDVEPIKDGFAAITYNAASETRRVRTSYDGGKTWQPIDAGLRGDQRTASIIEVGENFFCGHPDGIYRSSDKGKTWKLLLPAKNNKVFNLFVSGNVIYAIPRSGGC